MKDLRMITLFRCNIIRSLKNWKDVSVTHSSRYSSMCRFFSENKDKILKRNVTYITLRSASRFFRPSSVQHLKRKDNVPDEFTLIYRNTMERYIIAAHAVTFASALILAIVMIIEDDATKGELNFDDWRDKIRKTENEVLIYLTCVMLLAVIVHAFVTKLPLRIYKAPQRSQYTFIMNGAIPATTKKLTCETGEVKYIGKTGILPWKESTYRIKNNQVVILLENFFHKPADLYIMLGEQKDSDLK